MRIRSVSPDLCVSETMAAVSAELERTFVRLWTHCDDEGRCIDNPRLIKAAIYPLHDEITADVLDAELDELAELGLIVRYEADGKRLLAITSWDEYQHPQKPRPSRHAKPPVRVREQSRNGTRPVPTTDASGVEGSGVGEGDGNVLALPSSAPKRERALLFEALMCACGIDWHEIPDNARGAYNKAVKDLHELGVRPEQIPRRAEAYRQQFPGKLTPPALVRHWAELRPPQHREVDPNDPDTWGVTTGQGR